MTYLEPLRYSVTELIGWATLYSCCFLYFESMLIRPRREHSRSHPFYKLPAMSSIGQQGSVQVTYMWICRVQWINMT